MRTRFFLQPVLPVFLLAACIAFTSCKNKKDKAADKPVSGTSTNSGTDSPPPPPPPPVKPPLPSPDTSHRVNGEKTVSRCFINQGLKYETRITIHIGEQHVMGTVESQETGASRGKSSVFEGTIDGDKIKIRFAGATPVIGDASEWTDKPWILDKSGKEEKLLIIFNAKNYETNKWEDMKYEFEACK